MEHPNSKLAACSIFFGAHGGQHNQLGNAVMTEDDRLLCGKAYDCGHCEYLHQWVKVQVEKGYSLSWECQSCLKNTKRIDAENGVERVITGYYQAGRKPEADPNNPWADPDQPGLEGCTHILEVDNPETGGVAGQVCGWQTSFLQLILRRKRGADV